MQKLKFPDSVPTDNIQTSTLRRFSSSTLALYAQSLFQFVGPLTNCQPV
jgi:hypothetical protein